MFSAPFTSIWRDIWRQLWGDFSPLQLFAAGEQGAWYDPSDLTTLFQDAAGTTPVTAVEQPVRLMLDKSRGLVLGPELVTNGGPFAVTTGWTASNSALSVVSSALRVLNNTGGSASARAYQSIALTSGRTYEITGSITTQLAGGVGFGLNNAGDASVVQTIGTVTATGPFKIIYTVTAAVNTFVMRTPGSVSANAFFDVGTISVRELPGNHAAAPSDAACPVLRGRVNLLERTDELDQSPWTVTGISSRTANTSTATLPNGQTVSLTRAVEDTGNTAHRVVRGVLSVTSGASFKASAVIKGGGVRAWAYVRLDDNLTHFLWFNLSTGALGTVSATVINPSVTSLGNGAWLVSFERIANSASFGYVVGHGPADATPVYSGDGSSWFEAGATDLRVTNDGAFIPPYQRVTTSTDYDTAGFPLYLAFDGTDDSMSTGSVDFSGTDKMTVFAGVRALSDTTGIIAELSATVNTNNGAFALLRNISQYLLNSRGTTTISATEPGTYTQPDSAVLTGRADISAPIAAIKRNAGNEATNTASQGSGNYGNYPLFIGSRNNASLRFSGRVYSLIVRGAASNAAQIAAAETWVNGKTRAY